MKKLGPIIRYFITFSEYYEVHILKNCSYDTEGGSFESFQNFVPTKISVDIFSISRDFQGFWG